MPRQKTTLSRQLAEGKLLITNAMNQTDMRSVLETRGYTEERFQEGLTLYNLAWEQHKLTNKRYGSQLKLKRKLIKNEQEVKELYLHDRRYAKRALKNDKGRIEELGLRRELDKALPAWTSRAKYLYERAIEEPELMTMFSFFQLTTEHMQENLAKVLDLITEHQEYENAKGLAQQAKVDRTRKFEDFHNYVITLREVCRLEFTENREILERLGMFVRSTPLPNPPDETEPEPPTEPGKLTETSLEPIKVENISSKAKKKSRRAKLAIHLN